MKKILMFSVLLFVCLSAIAGEGDPVGVVDRVTVDTISNDVVVVLFRVYPIIGIIFGSLLGVAFLYNVYMLVKSCLEGSASDQARRDFADIMRDSNSPFRR